MNKTFFTKEPLHIQKNIIRQFIGEIVVDPIANTVHCLSRKVPWIDNALSKKNVYEFEAIEQHVDNKVKACRRSA